jgi:hypothetical protein
MGQPTNRISSQLPPSFSEAAMFSLKPDYEKTLARIEAFWNFELIDRPVVQFWLAKPVGQRVPLPKSGHATPADRWLDAQYQAEYALADLSNRLYPGDSLPIVYPNLGPEILSALYGCPLHFGDFGTSWTDPILEDWSEADNLQLDWNHPYLAKLHEITDAMLEAGKGKFITGMTDWHPGADAIAAFRDPANLAVDMKTNLADVKKLLRRISDDYFKIYDIFYRKLRAAGQPITTWLSLIHEGKMYVPSNDFSIMISKKMFDETFLPGIIEECEFLDRSIYHLDGPGALRHLDSILAIKKLNALQYVVGVGNEDYTRWIEVYQKAQAAGKGVQVVIEANELDEVMDTLSPRGLYLVIGSVENLATAEAMLKRLEVWTAQQARLGKA